MGTKFATEGCSSSDEEKRGKGARRRTFLLILMLLIVFLAMVMIANVLVKFLQLLAFLKGRLRSSKPLVFLQLPVKELMAIPIESLESLVVFLLLLLGLTGLTWTPLTWTPPMRLSSNTQTWASPLKSSRLST